MNSTRIIYQERYFTLCFHSGFQVGFHIGFQVGFGFQFGFQDGGLVTGGIGVGSHLGAYPLPLPPLVSDASSISTSKYFSSAWQT